MAPKPLLLAERLQRMENRIATLTEETNQLTLFCLDISPEYGRRIISAMQEMERNVVENISGFDSKMGEINNNIKTMVTQAANDCLALIHSALGSKIAGLDSRLIGLNKRHIEIDKELTDTIKRLDEFSKVVEETLDCAANKALQTLQNQLHEKVSALVQAENKHQRHCGSLAAPEPELQRHMPCPRSHPAGSNLMQEDQQRGRSRERFTKLQEQLVGRARSISSERDLRLVIKEARTLAAVERVPEI